MQLKYMQHLLTKNDVRVQSVEMAAGGHVGGLKFANAKGEHSHSLNLLAQQNPAQG